MTTHHEEAKLQRSLVNITADTIEAKQRREDELGPLRAGDLVQVVQVKIGGDAAQTPVWIEKKVRWPNPFLMRVAPSAGNLGQDGPHFNSGFTLETAEPVILHAQIRDWVETDSRFVTGAVVRFGAYAPDATTPRKFAATVHMTFYGYGAPQEDDSEG